MGSLAGRSAIVTGGANGIGHHYVAALADAGAEVMIADIADGRALADEIAARHGRSSTSSMICDVSDEAAVKRLVARTMEHFGKIDILVNNAALFAPLQEQEFTEIDVNAVGQGDGGQYSRTVPDGQARRSAHAVAALWQDHQYRIVSAFRGIPQTAPTMWPPKARSCHSRGRCRGRLGRTASA